MDYGKFKFDAAQKAKESRRKTTSVGIKEMKYRPKIGIGDFDTKTRQVIKFLDEGHKVKVTIMFRGREVFHPELGKKILDRLAERVDGMARVEAEPRLDGRNMVMVIAPDKRAKQSAAARATRDDHEPAPTTAPAASTDDSSTTSDNDSDDTEHKRQRRRSPPARRQMPTGVTPPGRRVCRQAAPQSRPRKGPEMPKMKTDRGAAKRFKITGTGKIRRLKANRSHLLEKKSSRRTRRLGRETDVASADRREVRRLLGR